MEQAWAAWGGRDAPGRTQGFPHSPGKGVPDTHLGVTFGFTSAKPFSELEGEGANWWDPGSVQETRCGRQDAAWRVLGWCPLVLMPPARGREERAELELKRH